MTANWRIGQFGAAAALVVAGVFSLPLVPIASPVSGNPNLAPSAGIFDTTLKPLRADGGEVTGIAVISRIADPPNKQQFESGILNGVNLVPVPDAFGPYFRRRPKACHAAGKTIEGFEWVRVPAVPAAGCLQW